MQMRKLRRISVNERPIHVPSWYPNGTPAVEFPRALSGGLRSAMFQVYRSLVHWQLGRRRREWMYSAAMGTRKTQGVNWG